MSKPTPGIKIPYLSIQNPVVEGTRCVEVRVPDDDVYVAVLASLISVATRWFNYQRDEAHTGQELAKQWSVAYVATSWEGCMNCEELTACITPLLQAQTAEIITNINNMNNFGTTTPGLPLTTEELEQNQAGTTNPTCDYDILWAQCLAIVRYTNESIVDTLEKIEAATNVNELAGLADAIPLIGWVLEFFGTELATDTINYFQEAIQETYQAQYTEEVENELAAALFCLAIFDCALSIDLVYDLFYSRASASLPDDPAAMIDLLEMLAGIDFDGTNVVDLMFWFCWGGVKLASFTAFQAFIAENFQFILALAVDDASPDWLLLADCGSDWNYELDSTIDPVWVTFPDWGDSGGTVVFQTTNAAPFGFDVTGINIVITFPSVQHLTGLQINALETVGVEGAGVVNRFWALLDSGDATLLGGDLPIIDEAWEVFEGFNVSNVKKVVIQYLFIGSTQEMTWQPVKLFGFGINPFV